MTLFTAGELTDFLHYTVSAEKAAIAERVASGWLKGATEVTEWPEPTPDALFSWAIELGAIAHENPGGLAAQTSGDTTDQWALARRSEILAAAAQAYGPKVSAAGPGGSFPPAQGWPDPAVSRYGTTSYYGPVY